MHRGVARLANVKMGYEMPTIENKEGMGGNFRGFLHHFWVFTVSNGRVVGVPKSPLLEEAFYDLNGMVDTVLMKNYGEINLQVRRAERNETIRVHVALVARLVILLHNSLFLSSPPLSLVNTLLTLASLVQWTPGSMADLDFNLDSHLKVFANGYDEMVIFAGRPPSTTTDRNEMFYAQHIAGLHAFRDIFMDDDLAHLSGRLISLNFQMWKNGMDEPTNIKMRIRDDINLEEQAREFCEKNGLEDCEPVRKRVVAVVEEQATANGAKWGFEE